MKVMYWLVGGMYAFLLLMFLWVVAHADLGIEDTASETAAKTQVSNLGVTQVYDHPGDVPNGNYVVPVVYNRTPAEGNGTETQAGDTKPNDVDYIPVSQLKGATGVTGATGITGKAGAVGPQGPAGRDAEAPSIDPRLGVEIREYDAEHWSVSSGASFGMQSSTARYIVQQTLTLKLGKSYEQRQIEKINKLLGVK